MINQHGNNAISLHLAQNIKSALQDDEEYLLNNLLRDVAIQSYKRKQIILYEGHPAVGVYWIKAGRVKVYKLADNGKAHILFFASPGDFLGLACVLSGEEFTVTGEMLEDGTVSFIERPRILELIKDNPNLFLKVTQSLAKRIVFNETERLHLAEASVRERVARALLFLANVHGKPVDNGILIDLKLSREDLANFVGTAVGTVLRLLKEYKEDQVILFEGKNLIILKPEILRESVDS